MASTIGPVGAVEAQAERTLAEASTARTIDVVRAAVIGRTPKPKEPKFPKAFNLSFARVPAWSSDNKLMSEVWCAATIMLAN
jgi:hypothetical protein